MITYSKKGKRHTFGMNDGDFDTFAEILWALKHTPPPAGFNRKPFTTKQVKIIEEMFSRLGYADDYAQYINRINGQ